MKVEAPLTVSAFDPEPAKTTTRKSPRPAKCPLCKHRLALHHKDGKKMPCRWVDGRKPCGCLGKTGQAPTTTPRGGRR